MLLSEYVRDFFRVCEWGAVPPADAQGRHQFTVDGLYELAFSPARDNGVILSGRVAAAETGDELDADELEKMLRFSLDGCGKSRSGLTFDAATRELLLYARLPLEPLDEMTVLDFANGFLHELKLWVQHLLESTAASAPAGPEPWNQGRWRFARP